MFKKLSIIATILGLLLITACATTGTTSTTTTAPLTHEQVVARVNANLVAVQQDLQVLASSAAILAPTVAVVATASGANSSLVSEINKAGATATAVAQTAQALSAVAVSVPVNVPVVSTPVVTP